MPIILQIFGYAVPILLTAFIIISVILFIKDGRRAKREGTGRKLSYTAMFIIGMALIQLAVISLIMLSIIAVLVIYGM